MDDKPEIILLHNDHKNKPKLNQCWPQKVRHAINKTMVQGSYGFQGKKNKRKAVTSRKIERKHRLPAELSTTLLVRFHGFRLRLRNFTRTKLANGLRFREKYLIQALLRDLAKKLFFWVLTQSPKLRKNFSVWFLFFLTYTVLCICCI